MSKIIQQIEAEQMSRKLPEFGPESRGLNSSFTVRKNSHGTFVERVFQTYSPTIDSVQVKRRGRVRSAKLYYLRGLEGKAARIREDLRANA